VKQIQLQPSDIIKIFKKQLMKITNIYKTKPDNTQAWFRSPYSTAPGTHQVQQANTDVSQIIKDTQGQI